jgi:pantetheine-phosphate adenylyltransferase
VRTKAIYPGSFDPVTLGHLDLIERASRIFDELIVGVAERTLHKSPLLPLAQRLDLVRRAVADLPNVTVESFEGLLVAYARSRGVRVLVRGLRAFSDFEYEFQMALTNRQLAPDIETMFLMPSEQYSYVSSSVVREVANLGGDTEQFVPPDVSRVLRDSAAR